VATLFQHRTLQQQTVGALPGIEPAALITRFQFQSLDLSYTPPDFFKNRDTGRQSLLRENLVTCTVSDKN
jgi:hypothetical protein